MIVVHGDHEGNIGPNCGLIKQINSHLYQEGELSRWMRLMRHSVETGKTHIHFVSNGAKTLEANGKLKHLFIPLVLDIDIMFFSNFGF
jgi:hypothetical protein